MLRFEAKRFVVFCVFTMGAVRFTGCAGVEDPLDAYRDEGYPLVENVSPGTTLVGLEVTLTGEFFGATQGSGKVVVYCGGDGGAVTPALESWSDTSIVFRTPAPAITDIKYPVAIQNDSGKTCPFPVFLTINSGTAPPPSN